MRNALDPIVLFRGYSDDDVALNMTPIELGLNRELLPLTDENEIWRL